VKRKGSAPFLYSFIGTLSGIGYFPIAPATFASVVVCIVIWFLLRTQIIYISILLILFVLGVWISSRLENFWGIDSRKIVIDESVGMLVTLYAVPKNIFYFIIGFALFRFFDIVKPYPINVSQDLKKGWGVVTDDVIAGMYSSILLWLFIFLLHRI